MTAPPALPPILLGLDTAANRFAAMSRDDAEALIDIEVAAAIREWRVSDATLWQRIRFRSRMIRTMQARRGAAGRV